MELEIKKKLFLLFDKYEVSPYLLYELDDNQIIKGMKGILAELEIMKKIDYEKEDLKIIQDLYSRFC